MTDRAFVVLPKPGSVRRRVDNPFAGSEEVAPLPPKGRENTYKDVALHDYAEFKRDYICYWSPFEGVFVRDYWVSEVVA